MRRLPIRPALLSAMTALLVTLGCGSGSVASGSPAGAGASTLADPCLVGGWQDGRTSFVTNFHGRLLPMSGLAGTRETITAAGRSTTHYSTSRPAFGSFYGHRVKEVVRGRLTATISADPSTGLLHLTHKVSHDIRLIYTFRGTRRVVHINHHNPAELEPYTCGATRYRVPAGTAHRVSS